MTTLLAFAFVVTILVFVHELGHFLAARWFGVRVDVFSIGFGPSVARFRRGGTEWRLGAIPFGGYVKMAGVASARGRAAAAVPDGFDSRSRWQRFAILFAGPAMNILFAFVVATAALLIGVDVPVSEHPAGAPFDAAAPTRFYRADLPTAIILGATAIAAGSIEILNTLGGLVTGQLSLGHLVGPVGLAQVAGESTALGWRTLLAAMAFISLNLGICNLLPIPILDGGQMLLLLVEGVTRRDVPLRVRKGLVGAGALAMLLLLFTTFYNDLGRLGWLPL